MDLKEQLDQAMHDTGVVGAAVAVLDGDRIESAVAGTANSRTGEAVTPATRFGVWSLTKPMTAMVMFQLAAAGHLDLNDPVTVHVPELLATEHGEGLLVHHLLDCNNGQAMQWAVPAGTAG